MSAGGGSHAARELKTWARRTWWHEHETPRQKAHALVELASRPWRFARELTRVFPEYAPFVERHFGVSRSSQLRHLAWARARHGLDPIAYYRFQLFRPERWMLADRYVQTGDTGRVLRWLVTHTPGYQRVFGDKRAFEAWCVREGLPTVRTIMEFEDGRLVRSSCPAGSLPSIDLFAKPSNWLGGHGAERWERRPHGWQAASGGPCLDASALIASLARTSAELERPMLLQPALRNAAADAALTPCGLCTIRFTTVRLPGAEPELAFAIYRMPETAAAAADNFSSGGLSCPIDIASGRLMRAVQKDFRRCPQPLAQHPVTGARIEGHRVAHWEAAVALVLRAHRAITWRGVPTVGWDVAALEDGPLFVEGNNLPCSTFAQMVLASPIGDSPLAACLNAHLRECFARSARG